MQKKLFATGKRFTELQSRYITVLVAYRTIEGNKERKQFVPKGVVIKIAGHLWRQKRFNACKMSVLVVAVFPILNYRLSRHNLEAELQVKFVVKLYYILARLLVRKLLNQRKRVNNR